MPFKVNSREEPMSDPNLGPSSPLGVIITNPLARKIIYSAYVLAGLALGGIQAWYGADAGPDWFPQALALYGYLGIPIGGLAIANTPKK
jgi:hypothetical protein